MNGLDITRRIYRRLRMPSQTMLPQQAVLDALGEVIARKKLDLALSTQNAEAITSAWFTPASADFPLSDLGLDVLLPIRVERRAIDSEYETGDQVPIVDYEVLDTDLTGAISFYGNPLRIAFRNQLDYLYEQQYRIVYEEDFTTTTSLAGIVGLPEFFASMLVLETAWKLLNTIEDTSPEFQAFKKEARGDWAIEIADERKAWLRYTQMFKGRAVVPKRTFFQNRRSRIRTRFFKG